MMLEPISVAIIEDQSHYREHLVKIVQETEGLDLVGVYGNAEWALEELPDLLPRIVLMDIGLPNMSGTECCRRIKRSLPAIQILVFTIFEDADRIFEALKAGAGGYLLKTESNERIVEAVFELASGGSPLTPQVARKVVNSFQPASSLQELTKREAEILELLSQGLAQKMIAERLFISVKTVGRHIFNIYEKLHVNSNIEAVALYLRGR